MAAAQLVADEINRGAYVSEKATVDKWPLNPVVAELRKGYRQFSVLMLITGALEGEVRRHDVSSYQLSGAVYVWERTKAPAYKGTNTPDVLQATVWAKNEKHAVKITNEHRLAMIASGKFK